MSTDILSVSLNCFICVCSSLLCLISDLNVVPLQNPKFQEPVTLDFLDAELENDIKVGVKYPDKQINHKMAGNYGAQCQQMSQYYTRFIDGNNILLVCLFRYTD